MQHHPHPDPQLPTSRYTYTFPHGMFPIISPLQATFGFTHHWHAYYTSMLFSAAGFPGSFMDFGLGLLRTDSAVQHHTCHTWTALPRFARLRTHLVPLF